MVEMSCSWIVLMLAGLRTVALACIVSLIAVALGMQCYSAGLFDKSSTSNSDQGS
jgi:hypothetical protein